MNDPSPGSRLGFPGRWPAAKGVADYLQREWKGRGISRGDSSRRKTNDESRPFPDPAEDVDRGAVNIGDPFGDRQTQADPARFLGPGGVDDGKTIENSRKGLLGNPDSRIRDDQPAGAFPALHGHVDSSAGRRITDGVIDQIRDQPFKDVPVTPDRNALDDVQRQDDALRPGRRGPTLMNRLGDVLKPDIGLEGAPSTVSSRERKSRSPMIFSSRPVLEDAPENFPVFLRSPFLSLETSISPRMMVSGVRSSWETSPENWRIFPTEVSRRAIIFVECIDEFSDFVFLAADGKPQGQVVGRDLAGRPDDPLDGAEGLADDEAAAGKGEAEEQSSGGEHEKTQPSQIIKPFLQRHSN